MIQKNIYLKIKELRVKKNLTQKEFYTKAGIYDNYILGIEMGKVAPTLEVLTALSDTYDVSISYFYGAEMMSASEIKEQRKIAYGILLKKILKEKNITEVELGKKIGKTRQAIGKYKSGINFPPKKTRDKIEKVLGVKIPLSKVGSIPEVENTPYSINGPEIENIASESTVKDKRTPPPSDNIYIAEINKRLQEQEKRILELEKKLIDK